jgi:outer membrane protein TolC
MRRDIPSFRTGRILLAALSILTLTACALPAQERLATLPRPVGAPAVATPLTLEDCVHLAFGHQPALAAARASLAAAQDSRQALDNLPLYARCATRELPYRKQQACLGVNIASAALWQAEWDARYAVTRNYFSLVYVATQQQLLDKVIKDVVNARDKAIKLLEQGNPDIKVTKIDIDLFNVNINLLEARRVEARVGGQKATAALREAIGLGPNDPLDAIRGVLPAIVDDLNRDQLIQSALANRGEMTQASSAQQVTELEVAAQARKWFSLKVGTFASASDIHAQPIPQGVANGEYRPGAIGLEMPANLIGRRNDRTARASDLSQRAGAVVDKTQNLIVLETDNSYLKWLEAHDRYKHFKTALPIAKDVASRTYKRLEQGNATGAEYIQAATLEDQIQAQYNEALYNHALALAALERITAGGYRIFPAKQP